MSGARRILAITAATLGTAAAASSVHLPIDVSQLAMEIDKQQDHISAIDLGERLMQGQSVRIFDLRSQDEYEAAHIPGAIQTNLAKLANMTPHRHDTVVLYSAGGAHAAQAWMLLRMRGFHNVYFLREGLYEWASLVLNPRLAVDATQAERNEFDRARILARFFGGEAKVDVPRADLPKGYWTDTPNDGMDQGTVRDGVALSGRRRGC